MRQEDDTQGEPAPAPRRGRPRPPGTGRGADALAAEASRTDGRPWLSFLVETSSTLAASLDYAEDLRLLARSIVGKLADICLIDVAEHSGALRRMAALHADPDAQPLLDQLSAYRPDPFGAHPASSVARTGAPEVVPVVSDGLLRAIAQDADHLRLLRALDLRSYICVPLVAHDRILGTVMLISTERSAVEYGPSDVALAEDLADRAALVLDNARLYQQQREVSHILARGLLPLTLPAIPRLELAGRYSPLQGERFEIGGDFYDVLKVGAGTWAAVIGDVCGKGPEAAVVAGAIRAILHAVSIERHRPAKILERLNEVLLAHPNGDRFATACYARIRPRPEGASVQLCSAGHPFPLVLRESGHVEELSVHGPLLGVLEDVALEDQSVTLRPGDALILFTDGIADALGRDQAGLKLRSLLGRLRGPAVSAESIAEAIEAELTRRPRRDDAALLVIRVPAPAGGPERDATLDPAVELTRLGPRSVPSGRATAVPDRGVWWTEWRCTVCGRRYKDPLGDCPIDHAALQGCPVSLPFLWLG